jgi:acyl-coenzyme A synthetase/AMP-(fatty) acid ligase/acyl carrier protein
VTVLATVPAVLRLLVDSPALARCGALRQVVSGGEQLPGGLARDLTARLPVALHNLYGPTETTVDVAAHTATPADGPGPVPIGRPVAGARLHVLDPGGEPVPVGVPGHLHVGGVPVARGYLGRPGLTADRFVPDPFGPPGGRLYRTGDLVRWDAAGVLHFLGRLDDQVKLRGHRVEPGEVAAALRALPGVRDAAAVVREDRAGDPRLVGYVVADGAPDPAELRAALHRVLPGHLVPAAVVVLPRLPLTGHGKLDAAALPAPEPGTRGTVAPAGPAEELVAAVWAEVLGVARIGADDDFFDLGGHSLHAARIAVRLSDAIGAPVPIALLFSHPTLGDLAAAVVDLLAEEIDRLTDDEAARQLARPGDAP